MTPPKTPDATLVSALRKLANDIQSSEGLAEGVLHEAADRIGELARSIKSIRLLFLNGETARTGITSVQNEQLLEEITKFDARIR